MKRYEIIQRRTGEVLGTITLTANGLINQARDSDIRAPFWDLRTAKGELRGILMDVDVVEVEEKAAGAHA